MFVQTYVDEATARGWQYRTVEGSQECDWDVLIHRFTRGDQITGFVDGATESKPWTVGLTLDAWKTGLETLEQNASQ